jgi:hypothetical protein
MATMTGSMKSREKALKSSRKGPSTRQKEKTAEAHAATTQQPPVGVQPVEPEDPYLAGAGVERQRQLLATNAIVSGRKPEAQPEQDMPAGLHATGTNVNLNRKK